MISKPSPSTWRGESIDSVLRRPRLVQHNPLTTVIVDVPVAPAEKGDDSAIGFDVRHDSEVEESFEQADCGTHWVSDPVDRDEVVEDGLVIWRELVPEW